MATQYGFFNKGATDPTYQAAQFDQFIDLLFDSGVVPNYFNQLAVAVTGAGLSVTVATGGAVVNGGYYVNDAPITLAVDAEGAGTNRYDRIIIRKTVATKIIEAVVLKGASAASPTIPALTQNSAVWEIALKTVYIASGAVTLIAGNLTGIPIYADILTGQLATKANLSDFTNALSPSGYQKLPRGFIIQWGSITTASITTGSSLAQTVTLPIAFPNNIGAAVATGDTTGWSPVGCVASVFEFTLSQIKIAIQNTSGTAHTGSAHWIAVGW